MALLVVVEDDPQAVQFQQELELEGADLRDRAETEQFSETEAENKYTSECKSNEIFTGKFSMI